MMIKEGPLGLDCLDSKPARRLQHYMPTRFQEHILIHLKALGPPATYDASLMQSTNYDATGTCRESIVSATKSFDAPVSAQRTMGTHSSTKSSRAGPTVQLTSVPGTCCVGCPHLTNSSSRECQATSTHESPLTPPSTTTPGTHVTIPSQCD